MTQTIYDFTARTITGEEESLGKYRGKVLLIVNTASKCGFTPHYRGLQKIYDEYGERGVSVLGFPCNQFGGQEPGSSEEIQSFCELRYGVSFPLYEKIEVNGKRTHPIFGFLKEQAPGLLGIKAIKWNFTKFLVDAEGRVVERFAPTTKPDAIVSKIESLLPQ